MSTRNVKKILLVVKARVAEAIDLGAVIARWLRERGHLVSVLSSIAASPLYEDPTIDLIVVLGGDGTILGVARQVVCRKVPILGINFGRVGFLSDIEPENWEPGLSAALAEDTDRSFAALRWSLARYGRTVASGHAVNDVVLGRASLARLVHADLSADGEFMGNVRADGFLLSSPIGSSGYSVSAGGPLLFPSVQGMGFVPICPFLNTIPAMVVPCNCVFRFELTPGTTDSYVTIDGQEGHAMQTHDVLEVEAIPDAVRFYGRGLSLVERLKTRSFILSNVARFRENYGGVPPQPGS